MAPPEQGHLPATWLLPCLVLRGTGGVRVSYPLIFFHFRFQLRVCWVSFESHNRRRHLNCPVNWGHDRNKEKAKIQLEIILSLSLSCTIAGVSLLIHPIIRLSAANSSGNTWACAFERRILIAWIFCFSILNIIPLFAEWPGECLVRGAAQCEYAKSNSEKTEKIMKKINMNSFMRGLIAQEAHQVRTRPDVSLFRMKKSNVILSRLLIFSHFKWWAMKGFHGSPYKSLPLENGSFFWPFSTLHITDFATLTSWPTIPLAPALLLCISTCRLHRGSQVSTSAT